MRRVVITGLGIVSCIGNNQSEVLNSLLNTKSGIVFSEEHKKYNFRSQVVGAVKNLNISDKLWAHDISVKLVLRIDIIDAIGFLMQFINFAPGNISIINLTSRKMFLTEGNNLLCGSIIKFGSFICFEI